MTSNTPARQYATEADRHNSPYRWVLIGLATVSAALVIAMPWIGLSVLFEEISAELGLTLVQVGVVWGISSLTGLFMSLAGGILGDRFGARKVLIAACFMIGITGASRALAVNFPTLIISSFLLGLCTPLIGVNLHKIASIWFPPRQLGLANGIVSSGFAAGFSVSGLVTATLLSPVLGGWRNVLLFFAALAFVLAVLWFFLCPAIPLSSDEQAERQSVMQKLRQVVGVRTVLMVALGKIGVWACIRGFSGYLPLFLRGEGWEPASADFALSLFFIASLLCAIPIPALSDRLGTRKPFLMMAAGAIGISTLLMSTATPTIVFAGVIVGGMFFDAFMGISITSVAEAKGVGPALAGTAIGFLGMIQEIGGTISPPLGNALAGISPQMPFYLWGAFAFIGLFVFSRFQPE